MVNQIFHGKNLTLIDEVKPESLEDLLKSMEHKLLFRILVDGNVAGIEDLESFGFVPEKDMEIQLVIDRFSYQADESLLRPTTRNEDSFRISLAVLSFLRENKLQKETLEDLIGFELNLHGKHDFTLTELRRLELYTNLKFLV